MSDYQAPLRDILFALDTFCDLDEIAALPGFEHADRDTVAALVEEAGRFMADVVAPTNRVGDEVGARLVDGEVVTPPGFADAYGRYVDAGWGGVPFDPEYGGGGFPWAVGLVLQEILTSANMAFSMCPLLTQGAIDMLSHHGSTEQKQTYLPKMITGEWTGTMNLTEPEAGSDVGALRTRAERAEDGSYRIVGTKIFISFGAHDMAENIVHLVLARTPDAPPGTKGISCFIVPERLVGDDGSLGERNDVRVASIEHKMGINGSPTCVLSFGDDGGAIGYLIGEENAGMAYMFTMMNNARLSVGLEGLALAERAWQPTLRFAHERLQGRAPGAPRGESSPIVEHPDVRRMLLTMKAYIDAMRALLYLNAASMDRAAHHPDPDVRERSQELVDLLIPLSKAWSTDLGSVVTSLAIQVHGGMGYVEETGVAQHYRDARITSIYEGTNGIQAMDLVGRKLPMRAGGVVADHLGRMREVLDRLDGELSDAGVQLAAAIDATEAATRSVLERGAADPSDALAAASPYLRILAVTTGGWLMARQALAARDAAAGARSDDERTSLEGKVAVARFFMEQLLPEVHGLVPAATAPAAGLYAVDPSVLAP
ncbi:acyl-CoA dehydrogenase [Actinomarinicola tropica]|uniref:3-methylmercaptopropionyl-CoA dehydrogenase n=1 Tax=Actinomarinicola tropica TaxID=2789776 RepID=A0A5Q2RHJ6_9ACTN|nr:acyl-CoA dehydrogenase [Actinomarinicola tropica]QGG95054.1 acyl-CoA dehydrogenase [Actinomarinicola tropica]